MKSCVIGGAGFIGSRLTRLLVDSGREVRVMGRSPRPSSKLPSAVHYEQADYGDVEKLKTFLAGAEEVIDLAYATAPQTSYADPVFDLVSNVPPSVRLLQEAVAASVHRVVLVSSGGTVYGVARQLPIREDHPTQPISPYGITKLAIENYGRMFTSLFNLPVIIVRPANAYGEGQRRLSGQGFIAAAMERIKHRQEVEIYGEQGTVRDYIHVDDVASGILAALQRGEPGSAYNIGTGRGLSNLEILRAIEPLASKLRLPIHTRYSPARKFDVPDNYLDCTLLQSVSGWHAQIPLEEGVERLWHAVLTQN